MDGPKSNEMIFLRSAEGPGTDSGGRGSWREDRGMQFDLPQLSPLLCSSRYVSKVRSSFLCLVTGENPESGAALRDQVLRETRKVWFRNVAVVEDSLWGCCFVFRWHKAFKDGRGSVEDEQRAGRP